MTDEYGFGCKIAQIHYGRLRRFGRWLKRWRNDGYRYARDNGPWSAPGRWR